MELDRLDNLYRDAILDHRRNPRNPNKLEHADVTGDAVNPFCGDEIHLQIRLDESGRVVEVGLQGEGCSINQASGSMLTESIKSKSVEEVEALSRLFRDVMQGDFPSEEQAAQMGDLQSMVGVREFPIRIKCALLAWSALEKGIEALQDNQRKSL